MKLYSIAKNQTEIIVNHITVFFSYNTPVACHITGQGFFRTATKYSTTTTKHINKFINRNGGNDAAEKPQEFFNDLLK